MKVGGCLALRGGTCGRLAVKVEVLRGLLKDWDGVSKYYCPI